ncbi:uncharacterized protein H6S33_003252 [Morchella sextelata]|uniref:uncharacterized protein n=1 Tax=Morchella sextelata TaxID=1174677 RepID=UPI001D0406FF|nr:uncharacterized protein H6S33_003252 [Morchella sextelata]KAH0607264.1 hypothetical protein H6S33_003252 [Morchella sextelata]
MPKALYKCPLADSSSPSPTPPPSRTRRLHRRPPRPHPTINWAAARAQTYSFLAQTLAGLALGYILFILPYAWERVPDWQGLVCPAPGVRRVVCIEPGRAWAGPEKVKWEDSEEGAVW